MAKFEICCEWKLRNYFTIEAETLEEAMQKAYSNDNDCTNISTPDMVGQYVDDSFEVIEDDCVQSEEDE